MIIGIGCDLFEVRRMEETLRLPDGGAVNGVFTPAEAAYCESKRYPARHFAARFAAKEAFLKALGTGLRGEMSWQEIEITNDSGGKPSIRLTGETAETAARQGVKRIHVSLSHTAEHAAAQVVLES